MTRDMQEINHPLTVSSKEQRASAPVSCRLMPCRVIAIRWPLAVMTSHSSARCR